MFEKYDIKEIRLLPMSDTKAKDYGFADDGEVRDYLREELPVNVGGRYYYNQIGIDLYDTDALILFQYHGKVMGYGIYQDRNDNERYYQFYADTIHNVEEISAEEFSAVYPGFKKFTRMKIIPLDYLAPITLLLEKKQRAFDASKN